MDEKKRCDILHECRVIGQFHICLFFSRTSSFFGLACRAVHLNQDTYSRLIQYTQYILYIRDLKYCKKIYLSRDTAVRLRTEATAERTSAYLAVLQMVPASSHWMTKYCNTSSYIVTAPKKMYRYFDGNSQHQPENKTTNGEEMMAKA